MVLHDFGLMMFPISTSTHLAKETNIGLVGYGFEGLLFPEQAVKLSAKIRNLGIKDITSVELELRYGDQVENKTFSNLNIPAEMTQAVNFRPAFQGNQCAIGIAHFCK